MDSGWAVVIGSIVGGVGSFGATWLAAMLGRKRPDPSTEAAKKILTKMLQFEGFKWRTMKTLSNVVGLTEPETRKLLLEIGARGSETDPTLWGLVSRNPLPEGDPSRTPKVQ
jgi:hypothetical protein